MSPVPLTFYFQTVAMVQIYPSMILNFQLIHSTSLASLLLIFSEWIKIYLIRKINITIIYIEFSKTL